MVEGLILRTDRKSDLSPILIMISLSLQTYNNNNTIEIIKQTEQSSDRHILLSNQYSIFLHLEID